MKPGDKLRRDYEGRKKEPMASRAELPSRRKGLYFLITISIPFVIFAILEGSLRAGHYGPDLSLFARDTINGHSVLNLNPDVQSRYFTHYQFSSTFAPSYFASPKPPGTYRIFCLGASTTVGFPYWYNGSFASFLRDRLRRMFPERKLEVINLGLTATNSFTVNDMAEELVEYEPDLLIVYDGHNEFYGALGIGSHESLGSFRWLTKTYLRLIHFRTFLLCRDAFAAMAGLFRHPPEDTRTRPLMELLASGQYIPYGSKTYREGLAIFTENLDDLKGFARSHQLHVILASQVSNLRDQPPFVSLDAPDRGTEERKSYHACFDSALKDLNNGRLRPAIGQFRRALSFDPLHADARYFLARCLDTLGQKDTAKVEYRKARDFDQLRFRASTDFNDVIRSRTDGRLMLFADMEKAFEENSPDSLIGKGLILEHLHPNSRGAFVLAKEYARTMREYHLFATDQAWQARDTVGDELLWRERSVTGLDEIIARRRTDVLTAGWPFKNQIATVDAVPKSDTLRLIGERLITRTMSWPQAHSAAASYYSSKGEYENAIREYRVIVNQLPFLDIQYYLRLAELLLAERKTDEFADVLRASLDLKPTISAYRALGDVALNEGKPVEAVGYYEKMSGFPQSRREQAENEYALAVAYVQARRVQDAVTRLSAILDLMPGYQPASQLLEKIKPGGNEKGKTVK